MSPSFNHRSPVGDIVPVPVPRLAPQPHSHQQLAQDTQNAQNDGRPLEGREAQGDHLGCAKPPVDIKTKVVF